MCSVKDAQNTKFAKKQRLSLFLWAIFSFRYFDDINNVFFKILSCVLLEAEFYKLFKNVSVYIRDCFTLGLKIQNIHRKTPVFESLFDKVTDLKACLFIKKWLERRRFPMSIAKFLQTPILKNTANGCFWIGDPFH